MSESGKRAERAEDGAEQLRKMTIRAKQMRAQGMTNADIADAMGISENYVRNLVRDEINWRQNCLTTGVHDGRPEALWDLPIHHSITMFGFDGLKKIVVARIYNDAMQFVEHSEEPRPTKEWAERTRNLAEEKFENAYLTKLDEIFKYYGLPQWDRDVEDMIERIQNNKLNPGYQPRHPHDSINMLCRIIGVSCSIQASKELG